MAWVVITYTCSDQQTDRQYIWTFTDIHRDSEDKYTEKAGFTIEVVESAWVFQVATGQGSRCKADFMSMLRVADQHGLTCRYLGKARWRRPSPIQWVSCWGSSHDGVSGNWPGVMSEQPHDRRRKLAYDWLCQSSLLHWLPFCLERKEVTKLKI